MRFKQWFGLAAMGVALAVAAPAGAQQCDDFDECTRNDMCTVEGCMGTPASGGGCDDFNECTVNDRCGEDGFCTGDSAANDTPCGGGCGTCQSLTPFPIPGFPPQCSGDAADDGIACDTSELGPCLQGTCNIIPTFPGGPSIAFCLPEAIECPETSGCRGACNPQTGRCDNSASRCFGDCERCNQQTNRCEPANQGQACDGFDPCTPESRCGQIAIGNEARGFCEPGAASGDTPTPTATSGAATPTLPPTAPPTATRTIGPPPTLGSCIGDCNGNGEIAINELITGVSIALGSANVSACGSFDTNASGAVEINELIAGVNAALNGCVG